VGATICLPDPYRRFEQTPEAQRAN
jgi:hypothetical protein